MTPRFRRTPGALCRRLGDGAVVLEQRSRLAFALNDTGARFWERLERPSSVAEMSECLAAEFDVAPAILAADLDALAGQLQDAGLLEQVSAADHGDGD